MRENEGQSSRGGWTPHFSKNQKTQTTPSHAEIQQLDLATREIMGILKGDLNSLAGIKKKHYKNAVNIRQFHQPIPIRHNCSLNTVCIMCTNCLFLSHCVFILSWKRCPQYFSISTYSPFLCITTDSLARSHLLGLNFNRPCYICIGLVNEVTSRE